MQTNYFIWIKVYYVRRIKMNIKHILHLSFINLSRRKKNAVLSILLVTCALTVFVITLSLSSSMNHFIDKNITNRVECRSMFVDYDHHKYSENEMINLLSKYKHIVAAVPISDARQALNITQPLNAVGNNDGGIIAKGANMYTLPDVIKGSLFKDDESNVGIIPEKFLPASNIESIKDIKNQTYIDGKSLLGKKLTGKCGTSTYTFTVIGVYDSNQSMDDENVCYIPYHDIEEINNKIKSNTSSNNESHPIVVVVDNYKNVQSVINQLNKNGMQTSPMVYMNTRISSFINIVGGILSIIIFIVVLINISLTTLNSVKDRTQEIGLLKSIGYSNKLILIILNIETIILGIIGFSISTVLSFSIILLFSRYLISNSSSYISKLSINLNMLSIILALVISIVVPTIACLGASIRVTHIQPSDAMKE